MRRFVLDASFALTWVIESERTPETLRCFEALTKEEAQAVVPALWPDEIANVFLTIERAKKLTSTQIAAWAEVFSRLPIEIDRPSLEQSLGEVRLLAQTHGLSAYDARYLHLAMREGLPFATRDKQLLKAATKAGVRLVN